MSMPCTRCGSDKLEEVIVEEDGWTMYSPIVRLDCVAPDKAVVSQDTYEHGDYTDLFPEGYDGRQWWCFMCDACGATWQMHEEADLASELLDAELGEGVLTQFGAIASMEGF